MPPSPVFVRENFFHYLELLFAVYILLNFFVFSECVDDISVDTG